MKDFWPERWSPSDCSIIASMASKLAWLPESARADAVKALKENPENYPEILRENGRNVYAVFAVRRKRNEVTFV